jgi:PAS domain S-box-containing protein
VQVNSLLSLAATVTSEHRTEDVLSGIVKGLAGQPGVALARIWLLLPGDLCGDCFLRAECSDRTRCLHLVASAGNPLSAEEDWSILQGHFRRLPLNPKSEAGQADLATGLKRRKVGTIGSTGDSILIKDEAPESEWIARPEWAKREGIRAFAGHPLVFRGQILGVLAIFSREPLSDPDSAWLKIFADQAAVALKNAQTMEDLRRSEDELRRSEVKYHSLVDLSPAAIYLLDSDGNFLSANPAGLDLLKCTAEEVHGLSIEDTYTQEEMNSYKVPLEKMKVGLVRFERTFVRKDGSQIPVEVALSALLPGGRQAVIRDISERKRVETVLKKQARQLQQVIDVAPLHMFLWEGDASASYGNRASVDYFGRIPPTAPMDFLDMVVHPADVQALKTGLTQALKWGEAFAQEARMRRHDGQYRWFLYQILPLRDDDGRIIRWCGTRIDIEDRKQAEERARGENLVLREEVDKLSMFESIVGTSAGLQSVLARVARVAQSDSTVLITGETGTGKELIARAVHKRSPRSARAFVGVNCAAIPRDLVASELFGHEKGAFTGALQRRLGRFELADGGTIFLDEIGELPAETQIALLRVLQEREFQRVGGNQSIRTDARVIAATHRDLPAAIAAGTFRSDLYYRINVFPIEVPPLRERPDDIRLLIEYFIDRYASKVGKKIRRIDKKTLDRLQSYPWPGNIRELQNVIERSVILCDTENFSVDESWLSHKASISRPLSSELSTQEKDIIEAALAESKGRVSGPSGAAAKLGMPSSTLDSKIKSLKIDKRRFHLGSA